MAFRRLKAGSDWKMGQEMKLVRNFSRVDPQSFGFGLLVGCILVSLTYYTMSRTDMSNYPILISQSPLPSTNATSTSPVVENVISTQQKGQEFVAHENKPRCDNAKAGSDLCENSEAIHELNVNSSSAATDFHSVQVKFSSDPEKQEGAKKNDGVTNTNVSRTFEKNPSDFVKPIQGPATSDFKQPADELVVLPERKPMCDFSHVRSAICDIDGDIRIIGKNLSSVMLVTNSKVDSKSKRNESWHVKPYARKWDSGAMKNVRVVNVKSLDIAHEDQAPPKCTVVNLSVPAAIIFSISGYTGNYFHDFTDVLVPLFQTAHQFSGEVQFLVTNYKPWWIYKYLPYLKRLSHYDIIDYDNDDTVHCFNHVIVGLRSDRDLMIDPANSPNGYSMPDFMKFMRNTYGLKRDYALSIGHEKRAGKRPRLLIIARSHTRKFMNLKNIVRMAEKVGFEVLVTEANFDVANFSRIVNSCDVMMGMHGAGLTNFVFLPLNAVLIQVVPFGKLDWIAKTYFGEPAKRMELKYLEYTISEDESTLTELYPRDDPVFKDPKSIHKLGWFKMGEIYLKQNAKLDVRRFRPVLEKALELLHDKLD